MMAIVYIPCVHPEICPTEGSDAFSAALILAGLIALTLVVYYIKKTLKNRSK